MKILSIKINRKKFFAGWLSVVFFITVLNTFMNTLDKSQQMEQYDDRLLIGWILAFLSSILLICFWLFLFNARCNDIELNTGEKIGVFFAHLVPLVGFFVLLYLLFKRGKDYEQSLNQEKPRLQTNSNKSERLKKFSGLKSDLLADMKNFWVLIFCVVTLVTCVTYVPYNQISPGNPAITLKTAHATIFDAPKEFNPRLTKIDYEAVAFREVLMLIACCAGYTVSTIIKKK